MKTIREKLFSTSLSVLLLFSLLCCGNSLNLITNQDNYSTLANIELPSDLPDTELE